MILALDKKQFFFSLRVLCCCLIAFYLAVKLGLSNPFWSVLTCVTVSNRSNQAFRLKGQYRTLGTMFAGFCGLFFSALFINTPYLLIVVASILASVLLAFATVDIAERKYFYQISSITIILLSIDAVSSPGDVFNVIVSRCLEILIGVTVVSFIDIATSPPLDYEKKILAQSSISQELSKIIKENDYSQINLINTSLKKVLSDSFSLKKNRDLSTKDISIITYLNANLTELYTLIMIEYNLGNAVKHRDDLNERIDKIHSLESHYIDSSQQRVEFENIEKIKKIKTEYGNNHNIKLATVSFSKSIFLLFILYLFWHATQYSNSASVVIFGMLAYALFGTVEGARKKIKSLMLFMLISLGLGWVISYALLPLAHDWASFCLVLALFIVPLINLSKSYPLIILSIAIVIGALKLQENYTLLSNDIFINGYIGDITGIIIAFFVINIMSSWFPVVNKLSLLQAILSNFFTQKDTSLINTNNLTYNLWAIVSNVAVNGTFTQEESEIYSTIDRAYKAVEIINKNQSATVANDALSDEQILHYVLKG